MIDRIIRLDNERCNKIIKNLLPASLNKISLSLTAGTTFVSASSLFDVTLLHSHSDSAAGSCCPPNFDVDEKFFCIKNSSYRKSNIRLNVVRIRKPHFLFIIFLKIRITFFKVLPINP